jgi:hypothetical protein
MTTNDKTKVAFFYLWKNVTQIILEFGSRSALDPGTHSSKRLDPDPHFMNADRNTASLY